MSMVLPSVIAAIILAVFIALKAVASRRRRRTLGGDLVELFLLALIVRVVAGLAVNVWLTTSTGTPFLFGHLGDDYRYHAIASGLAYRWGLEGFQLPSVLYARGFETILGGLYWLLTPSPWIGKVLNILMGSLIPVGTYRLLHALDGPDTAWQAGVLTALFPPLVFWSTVLYKDTTLTVLILMALIAGTELLRSGRHWPVVIGATGLAALGIAVLRLQSLLMVALALVVFALVRPRPGRWSLGEVTSRLVTSALAIALVIGVFTTPTLSVEGVDLPWYLGLDRIDLFYETRSLAFETRSESVERFFLTFPLQFAAAFFLPLPLVVDIGSQWQATEHVMLAGNLVWLWLLYYVIVSLVKASPGERRAWIPVLVMVLGTGAAIAVRGYALIYRHKVQMYPFAIMLASIALTRTSTGRWVKHPAAFFLYASSSVLVIVLYNYVRLGLSTR